MERAEEIGNHFQLKEIAEEEQEQLYISENFLLEAGEEDICFMEDKDALAVEEHIKSIVLYHWKRHYPSDKYFTLDLSKYELISSLDFVGNSHLEMLKEEYQKKDIVYENECEEVILTEQEEE